MSARTFHIRVNAKIDCLRWDDKDEKYIKKEEWSAELECDGIEKLEKLLELNEVEKPNWQEIPSFITHHLEYNNNEFEFNNLTDYITAIHTRLIREL